MRSGSRIPPAARMSAAAAFLGLMLAAAPARAEVELNQAAPALDARLLNGRTLKAKDLQGKVVVTLFWATWCPTCRSTLPELQRLYGEHQARGLEILALSIDESPKEVREFLRGKSLGYPVGLRGDAWFEHYGRVSTTPTVYVSDRDGVVRHRLAGNVSAAKIEALVLPLLERPVPVSAAARPPARPATYAQPRQP